WTSTPPPSTTTSTSGRSSCPGWAISETGCLARPEASEIEDFRARVLAARDRLRAIPLGVTPRAGPTDPETGEAWDRLNVVGHMAELLPFWCGQLRAGLRGKPYGRDEEGYRRRRSGIESG